MEKYFISLTICSFFGLRVSDADTAAPVSRLSPSSLTSPAHLSIIRRMLAWQRDTGHDTPQYITIAADGHHPLSHERDFHLINIPKSENICLIHLTICARVSAKYFTLLKLRPQRFILPLLGIMYTWHVASSSPWSRVRPDNQNIPVWNIGQLIGFKFGEEKFEWNVKIRDQ